MKQIRQILLLAALFGSAHIIHAAEESPSAPAQAPQSSSVQSEDHCPAESVHNRKQAFARTPVPHHHRVRIGFRARPACPQPASAGSAQSDSPPHAKRDAHVAANHAPKGAHSQRSRFALPRR